MAGKFQALNSDWRSIFNQHDMQGFWVGFCNFIFSPNQRNSKYEWSFIKMIGRPGHFVTICINLSTLIVIHYYSWTNESGCSYCFTHDTTWGSVNEIKWAATKSGRVNDITQSSTNDQKGWWIKIDNIACQTFCNV